ncbi:MAG TPA: alpha/beta fold hydrolase [Kofleriaceae bacterium]
MVASTAASAAEAPPTRIDFALADGNTIAGFVYGESATKPLVILIHGASDTHAVFDVAAGYRAARDFAAAGFGVLAIDRVGYGASSRPNGDTLDFATSAGYVHEVVQDVRGGALGFTPPAVVLLAPSAGADIIMVEAATYHDVDGVVVAFNTNQLQPALFEVDVGAWFAQGPYFDFGVAFRTQFFYAQPWAVEWVIDLDNATRSLVPRAEILSALMGQSAFARALIDVPVLLMQADHDALFVPQNDSALFTSSPDVSFTLLRNAGHKAFSHPTSKHAAVKTVTDWLSSRF